MQSDTPRTRAIERAQVGIRLEKRLTKVLKGLAEYLDVSLNVLVESILLHAVGSDEDAIQPPWRTRKSRLVCANLMGVYGLDEVDLADLLLIGNSERETPKGQLIVALRAGREEEALALLQDNPELKDVIDQQGFPVIVSAARINSIPLLEWLIAEGVDPEVRDEEYDDTALGWAVFYGRIEATRWLLERGVSHSHRDNEGFTPLQNAIRGMSGKLAKFGVRADEADFEAIINLLRGVNASE
jgi:hypothetical protein